jgi:outer membrane protein assembly factor BamB
LDKGPFIHHEDRVMRHLHLASLLVIAIARIGFSQDAAANWPQWRGLLWTGVAPHGDPPTEWSETKNVQWKVPIPGHGTSTPVIWGDKVFVQTAVPKASSARSSAKAAEQPPPRRGKGGFGGGPAPTEPYQFILLCLDRSSGRTLWQKLCREEVPHEGIREGDGSFAPASAMTDGQHVLAFFGSRGLFCFDMSGTLQWEQDLGNQETRNDFGEGATSALFGNTVVVPWDHEEDDFIVALDKRTGKEIWRQKRDEPTGWATPLVVEHGGQTQVITINTNRTRSYDLATGKQIWETEGLTGNVIPTPVTANGIVYVTSGFRGFKLLAIRLGGMGDITGTDSILWRMDKDTPYVPSPLLSNDRLYFFRSNNSILTCLDAKTGKPHYSAERIEGLGTVYPSPVAAAGRVYLTDRRGATVVIKDADRLEILATNSIDEPIDASPALVGKQLFLRSHNSLYCIAEQ